MRTRSSNIPLVCLGLALLLAFTAPAISQENTKEPMTRAQIDSLVEVQNQRIFPLFGERVAALGVNLPMPIGVSLQYYSQEQGMVFDSLQLGLSGGDKQPADFVSFSDSRILVFAASARFDVWILPFLNLYGILGKMQSHSDISLTEPIPLTVRVESEGTTTGLGAVLSGGSRRLWGTANFVKTWTFIPSLEGPSRADVLGFRVGSNLNLGFVSKTLSVWAGAMYQSLSTNTAGSSPLPGDLQNSLKDYQDQEWYQNLPPPVQSRVDEVMEELLSIDPSTLSIDYAVQKTPLKAWNAIFGAQMSLSPRWNFRTELGLGDRKSLLVGLEHRFSIK